MRRRVLLACTRPLLCADGDGLTGADVDHLRRTKWLRLGERDRTRVEWLHGNPYYLPSFNGICETYGDYETRVANLRITEHDHAAVDNDARSDLARALEMEKATAQRQLWDRLHESSDWAQAVKGAGWEERARGAREDVDRRYRGEPEKVCNCGGFVLAVGVWACVWVFYCGFEGVPGGARSRCKLFVDGCFLRTSSHPPAPPFQLLQAAEQTEDQAKRDLHRSDDPYRFPG